MEAGVLRAQDLSKSYGTKQVLAHLDLELEPGIIYGLVGRNGAGKTTLLSILTAQNTWNEGTVTYGGEPVWENQAALDHLCFSREFSTTAASDRMGMKVTHYLRAAAIFYPNWDENYARQLLDAFQLDPGQRILHMSKGEMSMVTILIALASRANLTFLDEPTAGLDVVMREKFYRLLLDDFAQTGRTFVISTHIIEEAASVFERVLILDRGRIVENSPTDELLAQFRAVSGRSDQVERACGGLEILQEQEHGRRKSVTVRGTPEQLAALEGFDVDVAAVDLQGVFVALCGHGDV